MLAVLYNAYRKVIRNNWAAQCSEGRLQVEIYGRSDAATVKGYIDARRTAHL